MIYCLTGKIIKKTLDSVVISCGGVGYFVQIPATTGEALPPAGQEGTVYTIMNVTENDVSLYGFAAEEQRDCFKMLTGVTGVPIRRLRLQWQWAMAMPSASAVSSGLGMLSRCSIMRVIS